MATARGRKGVGEGGGAMGGGFTANRVKRGCRVTWHAAAARSLALQNKGCADGGVCKDPMCKATWWLGGVLHQIYICHWQCGGQNIDGSLMIGGVFHFFRCDSGEADVTSWLSPRLNPNIKGEHFGGWGRGRGSVANFSFLSFFLSLRTKYFAEARV